MEGLMFACKELDGNILLLLLLLKRSFRKLVTNLLKIKHKRLSLPRDTPEGQVPHP